ncbi:hypothetical protein [Ferruginivarius sediminum]|uniref:Uncharacterized protein n=1 Tax=Ferruginivarius sediminum TaxID=2661937 RepID=A0A369TF06_9PROT|nr:hypothetical protein [Ferruginivarius sediminum]RDD61496.1 hypothetical protein DRB17_12395 [Ferruginivarius sediminum]
MTLRLPVTAAPGAATMSSFRREEVPAPNVRDTRRLRGSAKHTVFVGTTRRPLQEEALMAPEKSWCEGHCKGYWTIVYGPETRSQGRSMSFGFSDREDAEAFQRWRRERRDHHAEPEDFE